MNRTGTPVRRLLLLLSVVQAAVLAALFGGFLWFQGHVAAVPEAPAEKTDGIVVLTGGAERVETALRLLAQDRARRLLVTGAHRNASFADIAEAAGFDPAPLAARVTVGRAAATTRGNAAETAAWVRAEDLHSIRVVTAGYHMPRALLEMRRVLPDVRLVAHPVLPARLAAAGALPWARRWSLLLGEYAKWLLAQAGLSSLTPVRGDARDR
ncbi:YdcF family protein [Plastoroseomonas hellenica]|uniref:YdcF family protein n=1 Tax=Plastoroseomonas hellenica TaxID=2687306 RepID=UPI003462656C